jgi:hypothetical protein
VIGTAYRRGFSAAARTLNVASASSQVDCREIHLLQVCSVSLSLSLANELPYEVADFRCDLHTTDVAIPVLWWRSVGHSHTGYAVECFVDELLAALSQDPIAGRLADDEQCVARRWRVTSRRPWSPGAGRTPAPGSQAEFGRIMRAWVDAGADCPAP